MVIMLSLFPSYSNFWNTGKDFLSTFHSSANNIHGNDPLIPVNHYAFAFHCGISVNDILHSSFSDPPPKTKPIIQPVIHYVALDKKISCVVLAIRGTLSFR